MSRPVPGWRHAAASALSLVGHPGLLVPAAVVAGALRRQLPLPMVQTALWVSVLLAACVAGYGLWQVRAGRWVDAEASVPTERRQLNRFLSALLFSAAVLLWALGQPGPLVAGLAFGAALVLVAQALQRWLKVSLHAGFAVYAAGLLWPDRAAVAALLLLAAGVAWSRLVLRRHTAPEVAVGLLAGAAAGLALNLLGT